MRPRLIQYELTKLRSARFLWGLFALLLVVNGVLCYLNAAPPENVSGMEAVLEAYRADPEALMAYRDELNKKQQEQIPKFIEAQMKGETYEFDLPTTFDQNPDKSARLNDLTLISTMQATVLDMKPAYVGKVTPVIQAAARNKRELIESFGQTESSLACIKQDSIVNTYTARTEDLTFKPELKKGWDQFFTFEPVNLFILVVILVGVTSLFAAEHSGGAYLLRAYAKGRSHTAAAKLCVSVLFAAVTVLTFLLSTLLAVGLKCGFSSLSQAIQAFDDFVFVPYKWTVGGYLLHFTGAKLSVGVLFACVCALVMVLTDSTPVTFLVGLLAGAGGYWVYHNASDRLYKLVNPYGYMVFTEEVSKYDVFVVGNRLSEYRTFCAWMFPLIAVILFAVTVPLFTLRHPAGARHRLRAVLSGLPERVKALTDRMSGKVSASKSKTQKQEKGHSLTYYEWYKQVLSPKFILLLAAILLLRGFLLVRQMQPARGFTLAVYRDYLTEWEGPQTAEKSTAIQAENEFITTTLAKQDAIQRAFFAGQITAEEFSAYQEDVDYATVHEGGFARIWNHELYLTDLQAERGISADFLFEDDWLTYLTAGVDWLLLLLVLFTVSGTFADEYSAQSGKDPVRSLIRSTKRGRQDTFKAKMSFAVVLSAALAVIFEAMETITAFARLSLDHLSSPLLSVELFQFTDGTLSLLAFVILRLVMRFVGLMLASMLVLAFGELFKRKVYAVCAAALVVAVPFVCRKFGITFISYLDLTLLLDGTDLWLFSTSHGAKDFIIMTALSVGFALLVAVLLVLVNRRYAGNRRKGASK